MDVEEEESAHLTERLVEELSRKVAEDGGTLLLTTVPPRELIHLETISELATRYPDVSTTNLDFMQPDNIVSQIAARHDIPFVSLSKGLKAACEESCYVVDGHWNAQGIKQVASVLYPPIERVIHDGE